MLPSIARSKEMQSNEHKMVNEIQIECPDEFENCKTSFEKMVKMQHYGLPTRLLDVTKNPLVAMYFACVNNQNILGEIIILAYKENDVKYPQSEEVAILSNLTALSFDQLSTLHMYAKNRAGHNYKKALEILITAIQEDKPYITSLDKKSLLLDHFVYALKKNDRIIKQDGAFILCGLDLGSNLEEWRYTLHDKKVVVLIENKKDIISELDKYSINQATLFPEIENVANYLKRKYE